MQLVYQDSKPVARLTKTEKQALDKAVGILGMLGTLETYKTKADAAINGLNGVLEMMKPKEVEKAPAAKK